METPNRLWNRSFTLLWQGQLASSLGKNAFQVGALLWLKDATGSGTLSGLVGGLAMLPMVLLGPIAGVFVDRVNRGRMVAWTDVAGGALVSAAAVLFLVMPTRTPLLLGAVFVVTLATGLLDTFSQPSITASLPDLVPRAKLEAANGLNLAVLHVAMLVAQGAAGLVYNFLGAPLLVVANAIAYLWAGFTELGVRTPDRPRSAPSRHPWRQFASEFNEGARFVWQHRGMRTMLLLFMAMNLFVTPLLALMAFFVEDYLGLGHAWLGYLMACFGAGGLAGFALAGAIRVRGRGRLALLAGATIGQSTMVMLVLALRPVAAQIAGFFAAGIFGGIMSVHINTMLQTASPPELRGRVQSLSTTLSVAVMPVGMALAGVVFDLSGRSFLVIGVAGALMLASSVAALFFREYRRFLSGAAEPIAKVTIAA